MSINGGSYVNLDNSIFTFPVMNPSSILSVYTASPLNAATYTIKIEGSLGAYSNFITFDVVIIN